MDKTPSSTLADRLKQAMASRNLKQETLAEAAGVSQNTIHKLTSGKAQSTRKLIEIVAIGPTPGSTPISVPTRQPTKPRPPGLRARRASSTG